MTYVFQRKTLFMAILFCAAAGILIAPASAVVTDWELSPDCPSVGDEITISGEAESNEIIEIFILHEEIIPVSGKNYIYDINKLTIPKSDFSNKNFFEVSATGEDGIKVKDMNIGVKKFKCITRHIKAVDGIATISQSNVPSWMSYSIKIYGDVSETQKTEKDKCCNNYNKGQVKLTFKTSYEAAKADPEGNFEFRYDTDSLPAGNYTITIGDFSEEFTLNPAKENDLEEELKENKECKRGLRLTF